MNTRRLVRFAAVIALVASTFVFPCSFAGTVSNRDEAACGLPQVKEGKLYPAKTSETKSEPNLSEGCDFKSVQIGRAVALQLTGRGSVQIG